MTPTPSSKAADPFTGPSKAAELLPCHFCHSLDVHISDSGPTWHEQFYGCCNICNARGPTSCAEPDARRLWNTRHIPQAAQDVRERFEAWAADKTWPLHKIDMGGTRGIEYALPRLQERWVLFQSFERFQAGAASASSPARQMSGDWVAQAQRRIEAFVMSRYGGEIMQSLHERSMRVAEEALEFAQACGVSLDNINRLSARTYSRPTGDPVLEAAGVGTTLLAACAALGVSLRAITETNILEIEGKPIEWARTRQSARAADGVAMAIPDDDSRITSAEEVKNG